MAAVTGTAAGHPSIRATHRKTLELTRGAEIGPRATCVVGVGAAVDEEAVAALHGRVELTLEAGGESVRVRGRLNPAFRPGDPLVVRRAAAVTRDAVLIEADTVASDLPRPLVAELARPGAPIALTVEELPGEAAPAVLVIEPAERGEPDPAAIARALREGRRAALRADLAHPAIPAILSAADAVGATVLPHPGLPPPEAALAVAGIAKPELEVDGQAVRARDVSWHGAGSLLVTDAPAERLPKWLRRAERAGMRSGAIALDPGTPREQYVPWRAGEPVESRARRVTLALTQARRTPTTRSVSRPEPRTSR
jgi:hypothetical protein